MSPLLVRSRWLHGLVALIGASILVESIGFLRLPIEIRTHLWIVDQTPVWWCVAGPLLYLSLRLPPLWKAGTLRLWRGIALIGPIPILRSSIKSACLQKREGASILVIMSRAGPFGSPVFLKSSTDDRLREAASQMGVKLGQGMTITLRGAVRLSRTAWLVTSVPAFALTAWGTLAGAELQGDRFQLGIYILTAMCVAPLLLLPRRRKLRIEDERVTIHGWSSSRVVLIGEIESVAYDSALALALRDGRTVELATVRSWWHPLYDECEQRLLRLVKERIESQVRTTPASIA